MYINRGSKAQKDLLKTSGDKTNKGRGLSMQEQTYLQGFQLVEGPGCETKKTKGLFSKTTMVYYYTTLLTRRLGRSGSSFR
jgi:hypothetical protein